MFTHAIAKDAGVTVEEAGPATLHRTLSLSGRVQADPDRVARVAAPYPGEVTRIEVEQYARVERGQPLATVVARDSLRPTVWKAPFAGIVLQRDLEARAYQLGGATYDAPGQLVGDFLKQQPSSALGEVEPSYQPGVKLGDLAPALPAYAIEAMREALPVFGRKIKGYDMPDAVLTGVETRTSSPICIKRGADYQSINVKGLYPAGEGAGYAGGILSAGIDGIKVAEAMALSILADR